MSDARAHRLTVTVGCVCMRVWRWTGGDVGEGDGMEQASWRDCAAFPRKERCSSARRGGKARAKGDGLRRRSSTKGLLPMWHRGRVGSQGDTLEPRARFRGVYLVLTPNTCAVRSLLLTADKVVSSSYLSHPRSFGTRFPAWLADWS